MIQQVRIKNHHIKEFNNLIGVIIGSSAPFLKRVWIPRQIIGSCGKMIETGNPPSGFLNLKCLGCGWEVQIKKTDQRDSHDVYAANGIALGLFTIEVNIANLEMI